MVNMIPDRVSSCIESSAEAKLFKRFRSFETEDSICVLHSLGLGEHVTNVFGEIDFVIICSRGVLCVEVKGGNVYREGGIWYFRNRFGKKDYSLKGPFKQVQGNAQSLRQYLNECFPAGHSLHGVQFACCVMTPDCCIEHDDSEIIQKILFDIYFRGNLGDVIRESFDYWEGQLKDKHGFKGKGLNEKSIKDLAKRLRGDFRWVPPMKDVYDEIGDRMVELTDEQYDVLENHKKNQRLLVDGRAGTGKTLLAMEQCRRDALEGKKVLFLCFNRNIAQYVRYSLANEDDDDVNYEAYTLHKAIAHLLGEDDRKTGSKDYFDNLIRHFLAVDLPKKYDVLILDEGQDLLKEQYIPCLDRLLKGGLTNGRWVIFYDPNQNVYGENKELDPILDRLGKLSTQVSLSVNCRNTQMIAKVNRILTGFEQAKHARIKGTEVKWRKYKTRSDERKLLEKDLQYLADEGVDCNRIVILSPWSISSSSCCLFNGAFPGELKVHNPWTAKKNEYRFCTINTFKGLEADIIMLIDIESFADEESRKQNYVAISRARTDLYIYYSEASADEKDDVVEKNIGD